MVCSPGPGAAGHAGRDCLPLTDYSLPITVYRLLLYRFEVGEGDFHLEDARLDDGEVLMRVDADKRGVLAEGDHEYLLAGFRRQ